MGLGGRRHAPAVLPPGKTHYPLHRKLCRSQGRSGQVRKISPQRDSILGPSSHATTKYRRQFVATPGHVTRGPLISEACSRIIAIQNTQVCSSLQRMWNIWRRSPPFHASFQFPEEVKDPTVLVCRAALLCLTQQLGGSLLSVTKPNCHFIISF